MHYQDINTIVTKHDAELSAAEAHGMAAGMLCVNGHTEIGFWLRELLKDTSMADTEDKTVLGESV